MAYDDARKPPILCPSNIILSNCISRLHSSTEFTNCRSATTASELNFGRELRPKPEEGKTYSHAHFLLCYKVIRYLYHVPFHSALHLIRVFLSRLRLKCDGTHRETRFRLLAKGMSPFKLVGAPVQSTTSSQGVCISGSNAGYTKFLGSVKGTGYPFHLPVSPSLPLPCVTMCHHVSTGLYQ